MTRRSDTTDWSDARLDAAFGARAAAAQRTPTNLEMGVLAAIPSARRAAPRWATLGTAAAVLVVAAIVGLAVYGPNRPGPSNPVPGASGTPLGEPLSVSAALAARDGVLGGSELLVGGFLSPSADFLRCRAEIGPRNPTRLGCSEKGQWLMEQPESLFRATSSGIDVSGPKGPGFHPSFALVRPPVVPGLRDRNGAAPVHVQLLGHFHDRRAALCGDAQDAECEQTFVVDRVLAVADTTFPVQTDQRTDAKAIDHEADVDALVATVAPRASIASRVLVTVGESIALEPILADDMLVPFVDQTNLAWILTVIDPGNGVPSARTFMLLDGSSWFAEITGAGAVLLDRTIAQPTGNPTPALPPGEPSAFDTAPHTVLDMQVLNVAQVVSQRKQDQAGDRDEYAVAGWYVPPRPGVTCDPPMPAVHAPTPPCDEARHWLLFDPQQWNVRPGQLRADPEEYPDVLNPIIPVDVPFEVLGGWNGDTPRPMAVIVLGHFEDMRVQAFHGNAYFVVDALAWTANAGPASTDRVVRLTDAATEDPATVISSVAAASPSEALATWATVMDGRDLQTIDPSMPLTELTAPGPVWIVRRLVPGTADGRPRVAVETGYTRDNGTRVWLTPTPDSEADLATSIDLQDLDANTDVLWVYDYPDVIKSVRPVPASVQLTWHDLGPIPDLVQVARGGTDREVVVRWRAVQCARDWRLNLKGQGDGPYVLEPLRSIDCDAPGVLRKVLLVFDQPVGLDRFFTPEPCCG